MSVLDILSPNCARRRFSFALFHVSGLVWRTMALYGRINLLSMQHQNDMSTVDFFWSAFIFLWSVFFCFSSIKRWLKLATAIMMFSSVKNADKSPIIGNKNLLGLKGALRPLKGKYSVHLFSGIFAVLSCSLLQIVVYCTVTHIKALKAKALKNVPLSNFWYNSHFFSMFLES